jgi:hypothetical protein
MNLEYFFSKYNPDMYLLKYRKNHTFETGIKVNKYESSIGFTGRKTERPERRHLSFFLQRFGRIPESKGLFN